MKKITVPKIALLAATPASIVSATLFCASCGSSSPKVEPVEKQLTANENNVAWVEIDFVEQPKGDEAMINIVSKSDTEIQFISGENDYETIHTVSVTDKKALVIVGAAEKPTQSVNAEFEIEVSYINPDGHAVLQTIKDMKIQITVDPSSLVDEVHMLDINDFHGAAAGYGSLYYDAKYNQPGILRIARDVHKITTQYPGSIFLSAGDNNSGDVFSTATHGETLFPLLGKADIQYSAVGNHAFDWGLDYLSGEKFDRWARTDTTSGKYFVAANILGNPSYKFKNWVYDPSKEGYEDDYRIWKNEIVRWADPYKVLNMKGHRICIIGLTTTQTENDGNADVTNHLSFINYKAATNYAKQYCKENIGEADFNRIESFILLTHIESSYNGGTASGAAMELARDIDTNIDAVISAHSHQEGVAQVQNDTLGKKVWVGQAGTKGMKYLDTKIKLDNTKPTGSKLVSLDMTLQTPSIDYGGYDPQSTQGHAAAAKEYHQLVYEPEDAFNKKVADSYTEQVIKLETALDETYAKSEYGQSYDTQGLQLGHKYIWFKNVVEPIGAWYNRAILYAYNHMFTEKYPDKYPRPWISFINQDSLTCEWDKGLNVKKKHMFSLQTYENTVRAGYITVGQLVNIINYLLAGKNTFDYDTKPKYTGRLNTDYLKRDCSSIDLENGTADQTSAYLCGPLQFYGMRVNLAKHTGSDYDAEYQVKMLQGVYYEGSTAINFEYPDIYIYNPEKELEFDAGLDKPEKWVSVKEYVQNELQYQQVTYIPITINNFTYDGKLLANRMFKAYFDYNQSIVPTLKTTFFSQITRDLLVDFCENWEALVTCTPSEFDLSPEKVKSLVTLPTE